MPIETYIISIDRPSNCSIRDTKRYIEDSINELSGCFSLDDERRGIECLDINKEKKGLKINEHIA